ATLRSRLSGLLVGHEIAEVRKSLGQEEIAIIGSDELTKPYRSALEHLGYRTTILDSEQVTVAGLKKVRELAD
ncbi:MAG: 2-dehydro-3-deoxygalactonokinase, partial [Albidovulum sp.]|nr:2-dehydro-3-deoxygalactonokinase [Albidovulum sp.]